MDLPPVLRKRRSAENVYYYLLFDKNCFSVLRKRMLCSLPLEHNYLIYCKCASGINYFCIFVIIDVLRNSNCDNC